MNLLDQLVHFYWHFDKFQEPRMSESEIRDYCQTLIDKHRLVTSHLSNGQLIGYIESWRINHHQLGWILCKKPFNIKNQDIESGPICYVANITIDPDYRKTEVMKEMADGFFIQNKDCEIFFGESRRKHHSPFSIFIKPRFIEKYAMEKDAVLNKI